MKTRIDLAKHFNSLGFKSGVEVGVAAGDYSEILCKNIPDLWLFCVDLWKPYHGYTDYTRSTTLNKLMDQAKSRLSNYSVSFFRMSSMDSVKGFPDESVDFVYIDANHNYDYVKEDIREWSKKIKPGGILAGHDYDKEDVKRAVQEFAGEKYQINTTDEDEPISWYITI